MTLFGVEEHPLLDEIRAANLDDIDAARSARTASTLGSSGLTSELAPRKAIAALANARCGR